MVKAGYKQTEVGEIPEDWEVRKFSDNFVIYAGGDVPKDSLSQFQTSKYSNPIYANALQNRGLYGFTERYRSKGNAITVTARGSLGHAEYRDQPFFPIVRLLVLEPNGSLDPRFTTYCINNRVEFAIESTGVPQLTAPQIAQYSVGAPADESEQKAIADTLSDVDTLIASLEKLIEKKRDIKTATMQQLFTGKKRLQGFGEGKGTKQTELGEIPEDWELKEISEVAPLQRGFDLPTRLVKVGEYPVAYSNGIQNYHSEYMVKGPGVFTGRSGTIGKVHYVESDYWPHNTSLWVTDFKGNIPKYIFYMLSYIGLGRFGGGSGVPTLNRNDVHDFIFCIPGAAEQQAISNVLSDIDIEIAVLESRLAKTKSIKHGMMQELLTGRTRLV